MGMRAPVTLNGHGPYKEVDWKDLKLRIVAALGPEGILREFKELGVKFESSFNAKGKAVCHAVDRPDETASAFVNCTTGIYHSKGATTETLNLFDFALKHGSARFPEWLSTVKHYAEVAGIALEARKDGKGRILEATYDYVDEKGELLYQVIRYRLASGKKDFKQRRPDGRDGWIYDLEGTRRVLYRLPDVLGKQNHTVVVVEGEKDADRLNELFTANNSIAIATTSAQGASDTGRWESYAELLRSRNLVVIPDADSIGQRHARAVCGFLHGVCDTVKLIELPGVGPKGDVSDWFDQDNSLDALWALIVEAPLFDPATALAPEHRKLTIRLRDVRTERVAWLYENRVALGFISIFAGRTGFGKSFVTCDIVARLSRGESPAFSTGWQEPIRTLFISEDSPSLVIAPRLIELGARTDMVDFMLWDALGSYTLADTEMLDDAYEECGRPQLVVIDPPSSFLGDVDEHRNAEVRGILKLLTAWLDLHRVACIFISHISKRIGRELDAVERIIGSVAWGSVARMTLAFVKDPDVPDQYVFGGTKNNLGPLAETLAYRFKKTDTGISIEWVGPTDTTMENALNAVKKKSRGICAVEWLTDRFREKYEWESDELRKAANEAGISKNALWSPEVNALPIRKKRRANAVGDQCWYWVADEGWPSKNNDTYGNDGNLGNLNGKPY